MGLLFRMSCVILSQKRHVSDIHSFPINPEWPRDLMINADEIPIIPMGSWS